MLENRSLGMSCFTHTCHSYVPSSRWFFLIANEEWQLKLKTYPFAPTDKEKNVCKAAFNSVGTFFKD